MKAPHSKCGILARVSGVRIPPSPPCRTDLLECVLTTISARKLVPVVFADALAMLAELLDWHRPEMTGRKLFGSFADRWRRRRSVATARPDRVPPTGPGDRGVRLVARRTAVGGAQIDRLPAPVFR